MDIFSTGSLRQSSLAAAAAAAEEEQLPRRSATPGPSSDVPGITSGARSLSDYASLNNSVSAPSVSRWSSSSRSLHKMPTRPSAIRTAAPGTAQDLAAGNQTGTPGALNTSSGRFMGLREALAQVLGVTDLAKAASAPAGGSPPGGSTSPAGGGLATALVTATTY